MILSQQPKIRTKRNNAKTARGHTAVSKLKIVSDRPEMFTVRVPRQPLTSGTLVPEMSFCAAEQQFQWVADEKVRAKEVGFGCGR